MENMFIEMDKLMKEGMRTIVLQNEFTKKNNFISKSAKSNNKIKLELF